MISILKKACSICFAIVSVVYTVIPESFLKLFKLSKNDNYDTLLNHLLIFILIFLIVIIVYSIYLNIRKKIYIKGKNYTICIKYGDILKEKNCKKIITFDECYTKKVGNLPSDVNPDSICGQYLKKNPSINIKKLIKDSNLKPCNKKSKFKSKDCYTSGKLIQNDDFLLMAFAKLDENGLGYFPSVKDFTDCLSILWKEIDKYYGQKNVCIPILGSGITRIGDSELTKQELLDIIICTYKLSRNKIKNPYKLYIICKKSEDFSLNNIGKNI